MIEEAMIWAALITGCAGSWYIFGKALNWRIDTESPTTLIYIIGSLFVGSFCGIYLIFRFFSFMANLPTV